MRIVAQSIAVLLAVAPRAFAATMQLASVQINGPSTFQTFATGALVESPATTTGPTNFWRTIPSVLNEGSLQNDFLTSDPSKTSAIQYGKLDFTVESNGPVWMLTTTRFGGGGNSSGDWLPDVSTESQFEANGWHVVLEGIVTSETGFENDPAGDLDWLLFQRSSSAGETFSIRTEKYQAPVILQGVGVALPEPSTIVLLAFAGVLLLPLARRKAAPARKSAA